MTVAGIGIGAQTRNIHPPSKVCISTNEYLSEFYNLQVSDIPMDSPTLPESQSSRSLSPLRVVSDPRQQATNEGDEVHDPVSENTSMVCTMWELSGGSMS